MLFFQIFHYLYLQVPTQWSKLELDSTKVVYDVLIVIFVVNKSNNTYKINN